MSRSRCLLAALAMLLLAAAGPASALDQPLEGIPLPRAVTKFEHQLGVSDNSLPGGKHSVDKGQFALSSYDQSILAGGPPVTGDGPVPGIASAPAPAPAPAPSYSYAQPAYAPAPAYSYAQPAYAQLTYAYPQYQQQQGYTAYQSYQPMATNGYQYPKQQYTYPQYAQQGQYAYPQQQQYQQPQQQTGATGSNYWDYSQANGALAGANGDIASAAAFTDKTNSNQYANLGWHPTLERMMGVHKSKRNKGPRLALKGQLAGMKGLQKPHLSISPSVDPQQKVLDAHERLAAKARHGQGLAAMAHENHHAFHFPAYMVKNTGDPAAGQEALMGPNGEPRMKKIGPESSVAMGILISIFIGLLGAAVLLGWMHARKERKRNEMVALSGFVDDNE